MKYFSVKNWEKHQHYKDRNPPWIKLHKDLLHDYEFTCLQDASKLQLILIWVLASQMENKIPLDTKWLKHALHLDCEVDLKALSDGGFIDVDSVVLAACKQSAMPETEAEAETEAENGAPKKTLTPKVNGRFKPPCIQEISAYIAEKNYNVDAERFWNFYESKDWFVGKNKMKKWKASVANWNSQNKPAVYEGNVI